MSHIARQRILSTQKNIQKSFMEKRVVETRTFCMLSKRATTVPLPLRDTSRTQLSNISASIYMHLWANHLQRFLAQKLFDRPHQSDKSSSFAHATVAGLEHFPIVLSSRHTCPFEFTGIRAVAVPRIGRQKCRLRRGLERLLVGSFSWTGRTPASLELER